MTTNNDKPRGGKLHDGPLPPKPAPAEPSESPSSSLAPSITIDMSKATAEILKALARAQQAALTVGKDGENTHLKNKYASAEAMIRASRHAMADTGLAFIAVPRIVAEYPKPHEHAKQWVSAKIEKVFVLTHESGSIIRGVAEGYAIEGGPRAADKATAAGDTYLHGFILRNLFNLDRAEEDKISVEAREDFEEAGDTRPDKPRRRLTSYEETEQAFREVMGRYVAAAGDQRSVAEVIKDVVGYAFSKRPSKQNFVEGIEAFENAIAELEQPPVDDDPTAKGAP